MWTPLPRHSGFPLSGGPAAHASTTNVFVGSCQYSWERVWGTQEEKEQGERGRNDIHTVFMYEILPKM